MSDLGSLRVDEVRLPRATRACPGRNSPGEASESSVTFRQEGRGIGLANKVRAYALQAQGVDTVEANRLLHLPIDAREYDVAAAMLDWFGVKSIQLMTNNPDKVAQLERLGVQVEGRIPLLIEANPYSARLPRGQTDGAPSRAAGPEHRAIGAGYAERQRFSQSGRVKGGSSLPVGIVTPAGFFSGPPCHGRRSGGHSSNTIQSK